MNILYISDYIESLIESIIDINNICDYIKYVVEECNIKNIVWNHEKKKFILMQKLMKIYEKEQILFSCIIQKGEDYKSIYNSFIIYNELQLSIHIKNIENTNMSNIYEINYDEIKNKLYVNKL